MFYVMTNDTNRLIGTSILGFDEIPYGYNVTEIDGDMPMLEGILGEYCIDESGNIKYDPDGYVEPDDDMSELPNSFITTEQLANNFNQFIEDYDTVVCELYEESLSQQELLAEQDAAICELYELVVNA